MSGFARKLVRWHRHHGRHDLPWQHTRDPYPIWISEIMLQQTQVATVIPYYQRFLDRFPDVAALAAASLDEVLARWSGLGYYTRARNLHRAAQAIMRDHQGAFPVDLETVMSLPGIGRSTAAAICAFAYGARRAILDGNVKRVLARHFGVHGFPGEKRVEALLWARAEALLPGRGIAVYTQALMDLGASVCTRHRPRCTSCPLVDKCVAYARGTVDELPTPRPRRTLPQRMTRMVLAEHGGRLLFERRPAAGVWGALWSFPEMACDTDVHEECERRWGLVVAGAVPLPGIEHGFTHFRLAIEPWHVRVSRISARAGEPGAAWWSVEQALQAALPAPVRRILLEFSRPERRDAQNAAGIA